MSFHNKEYGTPSLPIIQLLYPTLDPYGADVLTTVHVLSIGYNNCESRAEDRLLWSIKT